MNKQCRRVLYSIGVLTCAFFCALNSSRIANAFAEDNLDFSNGENVREILAGNLLEKTLKTTLPSEEKTFLNSQTINKLKYSESFNKSDVRTSRIGTDLYVFANSSTYVDGKGRTYTWYPKTVDANGVHSFAILNDSYYSKISDPSCAIENVKVNYELSISVPHEFINNYRNLAYTFAETENENYNTYLSEKEYWDKMPKSQAEFDSKNAIYQQYLIDYADYCNKYENYQNYLSEYQAYQDNLALYKQYLIDKQNYQNQTVAYAQYLEDLAYYNANKDENLREYNEYGYFYDCSRYQIEAMKIPYIVDTERQASLYSYIWSDKASMTLEHKSELLTLGIPELVIDNGNNSTYALRRIFDGYKKLKTDPERYAYLFVNYDELADNIYRLCRTLEFMWRDPKVLNLMKEREKVPQYKSFLSMVIYFANAINDIDIVNYEGFNEVSGLPDPSRSGYQKLDANYKVDTRTYKQILKGYTFIEKGKLKAKPARGDWPTKQVDLLVEPDPVAVPVEPTVVKQPVAPTPISNPTAPVVVEKPLPYDSTKTEPVLPESLQNQINFNLVKAYRNNKIHEHPSIEEDISLILNGSLNINVLENTKNLAIFLDAFGNDYSYQFFDMGVSFTGKEPAKPGDNLCVSYLFKYWSNNALDEETNLSLINESTILHPVYEDGPDTPHDITWVYPTGSVTVTCYAGTTPEPPTVPEKEETNDHYYVFNSWSPAIHKVDAPQTYLAEFEEFDKFDISIEIDDQHTSVVGYENQYPNLPTSFDTSEGTHYDIVGWEEEVTLITGEKTYHAIYEKSYTITWNICGEITSELVPEGQPITYGKPIPSDEFKTKEEGYYLFAWDTSFDVANDNQIIFGSLHHYDYPVITFSIDNHQIDHTGEFIPGLEGHEIVFPEMVTIGYTDYVISGYHETSSNYYVLDFEKNSYVPEDILINKVDDTIVINGVNHAANQIDLSTLFNKMKDESLEVTPMKIVNNGATINLSLAQVNALINKDVQYIYVEYSNNANGSASIRLRVLNSSGKEIELDNFNVLISLNNSFDERHSDVYLNDEKVNSTMTSNELTLRVKPNLSYTIKSTYSISVQSSSNVQISVSKENAQPGEQIHFDYHLSYGFKVLDILVTKKNGEVIPVDENNNFVMPQSDVKITINSLRETYTLKLMLDNQEFASYRVNYGTVVNLPMFIVKASDASYEYEFIGWGIDDDKITVTKDIILTAEFNKKEVENTPKPELSKLMKTGNIIAIGCIGGGCVVAVVIILIKIKKPKVHKQN